MVKRLANTLDVLHLEGNPLDRTQALEDRVAALEAQAALQTPTTIDAATEEIKIVDAGSAGATEAGWIEVTLDGVTGYVRVYAAK